MNIIDCIRDFFVSRSVTSETLEREALQMLAAKPGQWTEVKSVRAHQLAGTFERIAEMRKENERIRPGMACTAAIYYRPCELSPWDE